MVVSRLALGCGNFGGVGSAPAFFGQGENEEQARAILDAAVELGITLLDTADAYGGGRSERWLGRWLEGQPPERRSRAVLTTKVFHSVEGDPTDSGLARDRVLRQVEGSLERLRVARIDLYLIHEPDPETPLEETLEALDELVRDGRVRAIGASNIAAEELERALSISRERGLARFECVQNAYSLLERGVETSVLPLCEREGIAFTAFSPLSGGWLTGKYRREQAPPAGSRMALRPEAYEGLLDDRVFTAVEGLTRAADARGIDAATLSLAWLLGEERVTSVILGPRRPEHLEPARAALALELTAAERAELGALFSRGD